ncbi:hypothetical protein [Glycomyces harbinensis]|nr:hypothetical protein [Glycomyces harbinensis]
MAAIVIGGTVMGALNADEGEYVEAVVLDTWSEETCGWSGPPEHQTYSCTTSYRASVSYRENGSERTAEVEGSFEVGERTEVWVGRFDVANSRWEAFASWFCGGLFVAFFVWVLAGMFE